MEENVWKTEATKRLPNLKKLDGEPVINEEIPLVLAPSTPPPEVAEPEGENKQ